MSAVVCYHYPCVDGIFAALVAREALRRSCTSLRFVPLKTNWAPQIDRLGLKRRDTVYLLDTTVSVDFVVAIAANCAKVVVLDHHLTAWTALRDAVLPVNVELRFDLEKCGATIALEYFAPNHCLPQKTHRIIKSA